MAGHDPLSGYVLGYPKLAAQMELQPETSIFRRFGFLNAQNLLYFQAELTILEELLQERQKLDSLDGTGRKSKYALNWFWLEQSTDDGDTSQLDLVLKIRETMKEYNHALLQQSMILKLSEPDNCDLEHIQDFLEVGTTTTKPVILPGPDGAIWGSTAARKSCSPDLVSLCPREKEDPFSNWVVKVALPTMFRCGCDRFKKVSRKHGVVGYMDSSILKITQWLTSIFASLLPIASILVLYRVHSMPARLGIIAGFNILLSVSMIGFAGAKRAEVFAVTAA